MSNKKLTPTEEIEDKIKKILSKGSLDNSEFKQLMELLEHNTAVAIKQLHEEIWALKQALARKGIIKLDKVKYKEGKG